MSKKNKTTGFILLTLLLLLQFNTHAQKSSKGETTFGVSQLGGIRGPEPTFWWTDMHNKELQLMFHGNNIAQTEFSIDYPGVTITDKKLTDNPNYVFLYLNIDASAKAGKFNITLKNGRKKQLVPYELKARREGSALRESFSEKDNVYLIMPDRFANGKPENDAVKGYHQGVEWGNLAARQGGDIEGIIQNLPHLEDLGITALWTTPLLDNNDTVYSYHHYGSTDYYKIDPRLGKNEDYLRLSQKAAEHGIKMIIDMVPNHCGGFHWWSDDLPASDWYNQWPSYTSSNYRVNAWTDPHASKSDLYRLTNGWFAPNMPDLNLSNSLLYDYLKQVYIFWIEYADIAGIRVDTYPYNDLKTAARFIQEIRDEYPNMNVVGECWVKSTVEAAYYQSGNNNKDGFDSRLQSVMDFILKDKLAEVFNEPEAWNSGLMKFYEHFAQDFAYANTNLLMNFVDNHDIDRYSNEVKGDLKKYKMGLALLTTVRGYPQIYYGTEIMLDGIPGSYEGTRFTFPGGWKEDERNAFLPEGRTDKENEVYEYLKTLLHYRKNSQALQSGKMTQFIPENGVYVFFRKGEDKTVMVITNNNEAPVELATGRFAECIGDLEVGIDIHSRFPHDLKYPIPVDGKTVLVLELSHWL